MTRSVKGRARALFVLLTLALLAAFVVACKGGDGPAGATGPTGPAGPTGAAGSAGPAGPAGPVGPAGPTGVKGDPGQAGSTGQVGARGPVGPAGKDGGLAGVVFVYDAAGGYAAGLVDKKTGQTTVDIAGAGFEPAEVITLTIESGAGSTTLSTSAAVEGNLNGAFYVTGVVLPSSVGTGNILTVKATGDKGTVGFGPLVIVNKITTN